ncbi:MAG: FAD-binding oxidoreductase [Rhodothermales bacterium]
MTERTTSFWIRNNRPSFRYDAVIVGGGIVGCATAFWLRRIRPGLNIAILEREYLGSGASGRNAGFVLQGTATSYALDIDRFGRQLAARLYQLTLENRNLIFSEIPSDAIDAHATGSVTAAGSDKESESLRKSEGLLRQDGFAAEYHSSAEINGILGSRGFYGGLLVPSGGVLDPVKLLRFLASQSRATLYEYDPVESVHTDGSMARIVTGHREFESDHVLVSANAYLPLVLPESDGARHVRPVRAQMLATAPVPVFLERPVYSHDGYFYVRQHASGRILVGGARHLHVADEVGYSDAVTSTLQRDLESYLSEFFPRVGDFEVVDRWSGTMGFSPDGRPSVGSLPGNAHGLWVAGFTGHGMSIAFRMGLLLARRMLGDADEYAPIFSADRHAEVDDAGDDHAAAENSKP